MATMIIDRQILPEQIMSFFSSPRIAVTKQPNGDVLLSPIFSREDYDNDADFFYAVTEQCPRCSDIVRAGKK